MIDDNRSYRIALPKTGGTSKKIGAIIFNHGYRGTAAGLMRNKSLRATVNELGLAFVAPKSFRDDWDIPDAPNPGNYSELAYFDALKNRLVEMHNVDPKRIMVTGFSAGGMMTWNLACDRGSEFAGFVPIAGTFWGELSAEKNCPDMSKYLIHMHGLTDKIVPIKGRPIGSTVQGDVGIALSMMVRQLALGEAQKLKPEMGLNCEQRLSTRGKGQGFLQYCLHPGGHTIKSQWIRRAWLALESAGAFAH